MAISSKARSLRLPELPTIDAAAVPGYAFDSWNGFLAPKAPPRAIVTKLHATIPKALAEPEMKQLYAMRGLAPHGSASPGDFAKVVQEDFDRIGKLMKIAGIKPE